MQVRAVKLRREKIVVALEHKVLVYDFKDLKLLHSIETVSNTLGLVALSPAQDNTVMACPGLHCGQAGKLSAFLQSYHSAFISRLQRMHDSWHINLQCSIPHSSLGCTTAQQQSHWLLCYLIAQIQHAAHWKSHMQGTCAVVCKLLHHGDAEGLYLMACRCELSCMMCGGQSLYRRIQQRWRP